MIDYPEEYIVDISKLPIAPPCITKNALNVQTKKSIEQSKKWSKYIKEYGEAVEKACKEEMPRDILSLEFYDSSNMENISFRDYFVLLLVTLMHKEEGFSGKRPLGDSGWKYDLYKGLIQHDLVKGKLDEDGYVDFIDEIEADDYLQRMVNSL